MQISSATAVSATRVDLAVTGTTANADLLQVQYATRPDFNFGLAPLPTFPVSATLSLRGLNQAGTYYFRVRERVGGVWGDFSPTAAAYTPLAANTVGAVALYEPALIVPPQPVIAWGGDALPGYPTRALGRDDPNSQWWATGGTVAVEMQTAGAPVNTIALLASNLPEDGQINVRAGSTASAARTNPPVIGGGRPWSNLAQRDGYHALLRLPVPIMAPFWRIEISGTFPGSLFAATYVVLGLARVSKRMAAGPEEATIDAGALSRDRTGAPNRVGGIRRRTYDFELVAMPEEVSMREYSQLRRLIGFTDPVLVVPNPAVDPYLHDRMLYGTLTQNSQQHPYARRHNRTISIDSLI